MFKPLYIKLLLVVFFQVAYAQNDLVVEKYIPVTTYMIRDGLPSNFIQDIVQDDNDLLWLATQNGLSRFDSSQFNNFSKDKSDPYSLPDTLVENLILMPDGNLWMSIYDVGISVFDKFTYKTKSIKNTQSSLFELPNNNLYGIDRDLNNNIWFSLFGEGIYQWNTIEGKFYKHLETDKNAWLSSKQTFEIMVDARNRLWVCTIDSKVYYYDINTGESKYFDFSSNVNDPLSSPIYGFTESKNGEVYAGGYAGVFKYNEITQKFDNIVSKSMISKFYDGERKTARRIMMDSKDNLWIGTTSSLLQYSNNQLKRIIFYNDEKILADQWTTKSIMEASDGNIWIGTTGIGLIKVSSDWERYNVSLSIISENVTYRRASQNKNYIWLVQSESKLEQYEYLNSQLVLKASILSPLGEEHPNIDIVYQDEPDKIWISSSIGINKVIISSGEISTVLNDKDRKLGAVKYFYRDKNKRFYFYLFTDKQMGYFDEADMIAHMVESTDENFFSGDIVNQMSLGIDGKLWFATNGGIVAFDMQTHKFNQVYEGASNLIVSSFYIEKNNKSVWIIVDGGLYQLAWTGEKLEPLEDKFSTVLPKIIFDKITEVKDDLVIIITEDSGLVEINIKTLNHSVYSKENGLPSNMIINVLFPDNIPLIVTEFGVALQNKNFDKVQKDKPKIIIDTLSLSDKKIDISRKTPLILEHNYGSLDFDMSLISYVNSAFIEYEYMLVGVNDKWINRGNNDKFSFLNLNAGKYVFKVRGRSNYDTWSDVKQFSFIVKTPPWKSIWAYGLYSLLFLAVILWLMYLYKRKILYEHEITKQQTQKHIANAASKAKSDFLARVSHEIRTPLNGVLGMGELLLDTSMDEEQRIYADSIMTSGHHLLEIINDILDLSKIEAGKLELEYKSFDLLLLVDEVVGVFTSQSKQKKLLFTCVFDEKINRNRLGDAIRIKQILFNLLSNAFKFTKHGEISLLVTTEINDINTVLFRVIDTGMGIDNDYVEELFQPFVQADTAITRKYGGTGLGLAIVKQLVEKMQGTISAHARSQQGSVFEAKIYLKTDKEIKQKVATDMKHNVCLLIKQNNLKHSLEAYLNILNIKYTDSINSETSSVFVDALSTIDSDHLTQLIKISHTKVIINFIGFDSEYIGKELLKKVIISRIIPPPITFNNIEKAYTDNQVVQHNKQPGQSMPSVTLALKLLVVEDNIVNQQVSIEMLEKMGHIVDIVDNAEEALNRLNRNKYDILLLDYHLPMMDGLSLIKKWSNIHKTPVIMITADLTDDVLQKCMKLNINNIVAKPFSQLHLFTAIEKALAQTS